MDLDSEMRLSNERWKKKREREQRKENRTGHTYSAEVSTQHAVFLLIQHPSRPVTLSAHVYVCLTGCVPASVLTYLQILFPSKPFHCNQKRHDFSWKNKIKNNVITNIERKKKTKNIQARISFHNFWTIFIVIIKHNCGSKLITTLAM